jgi:hypothetical protein
VRRDAKRAALAAGGFAALAFFTLAPAGCLEATPPPATGYVGGDGEVVSAAPTTDSGGGERDPDATPSDAAVSEAGPGVEVGADAWAGTWKFTAGSEGLACGNSISVVAVSGFLDITPSSSGTLLSVTEDGCTFHFTLEGATATSDPDQACAAWAIPTIPLWTLTMQADGTLHEMLGGRISMNGETCTISGGSTLVRQ